ncbi:MAG: asparaginase [Planctomyces sp.]|nr:asparaginase [Planctomyces sp.]MBA4039715.1 asparaginase [Planctomyces sp.]
MKSMDRRRFLTSAGSIAAASLALSRSQVRAADPSRLVEIEKQPAGGQRTQAGPAQADAHRGMAVVSSGNGLPAVTRAMELLRTGSDPLVAIVQGVAIVEADPNDLTVGLGALPNEEGVVEVDASVMHGPLHKAGAVGAMRNILHPAQVALKVLQTTDHVMLVGEGANRFARAHGFPEQELLTERARAIWLRWKSNLNPDDDWLDEAQMDWSADGTKPIAVGPDGRGDGGPIPFTTGTIHCSAVTGAGDIAGCTTTSGLSYKIPGRLGDSPIIGAGCYTDNEVGSAGGTGRGEAMIESVGAFAVVQQMERGLSPTEACMAVLKKVSDRSVKQRRLRQSLGDVARPNFGLTVYALRKDGAYGSATMYQGGVYTAADGTGSHTFVCPYLYERRASP